LLRRGGHHLVVHEPVLVTPGRAPRRVLFAGAAGPGEHAVVEQPLPESARREPGAAGAVLAGGGHRGGAHGDGLQEVHGHLPRVPLGAPHEREVEVGARGDTAVVQPRRLAVLRQQRGGLQRLLDARQADGRRAVDGGREERVDGAVERGEDGVVFVLLLLLRSGEVVTTMVPQWGREQSETAAARGVERGGVSEERAQVVVEEGDEGVHASARRHRRWRRRHCVAAMPVLGSKLFRRHQSPPPGTGGCGAVGEAWLQWLMPILVWYGERLVPVRPLLTSWSKLVVERDRERFGRLYIFPSVRSGGLLLPSARDQSCGRKI
jgi:hypothetical protein